MKNTNDVDANIKVQKSNATEITNTNKACNDFNILVKNRIANKANSGCRGWDTLPSKQLCNALRDKMQKYNDPSLTPVMATKLLIDISALSMMVHKALTEGR